MSTSRDKEIFDQICEYFSKGITVKECCRAAGIVESTLANIRNRLFGKLRINDEGEVVPLESLDKKKKKSVKNQNSISTNKSSSRQTENFEVEFVTTSNPKSHKKSYLQSGERSPPDRKLHIDSQQLKTKSKYNHLDALKKELYGN